MRIEGGSATGDAVSHSRWPSWCAVLFEKSDMEEDVVWSKVGEGAPRQTYDKTSNGPHTVFYVTRATKNGKIVKPAGRNTSTVISVPLLISFLCENNKNNFTKNPPANVVKKHVRMPFQPPFSFLFCAKTKKNCADKKYDVTKHVRLIFSPAGEIL